LVTFPLLIAGFIVCHGNVDNLISDLDDTLYPLSSGLAEQVRKNIQGNDFTELNMSSL